MSHIYVYNVRYINVINVYYIQQIFRYIQKFDLVNIIYPLFGTGLLLIYHNNMRDLLCYLNNSSNYHLNIYQMKCISHYYYIYLIL